MIKFLFFDDNKNLNKENLFIMFNICIFKSEIIIVIFNYCITINRK